MMLPTPAKGLLFTWGMGRYGRLGHGDETDQNAPRLVGELLNTHIAGVALGERHTAACSGTHLLHEETLNSQKNKNKKIKTKVNN